MKWTVREAVMPQNTDYRIEKLVTTCWLLECFFQFFFFNNLSEPVMAQDIKFNLKKRRQLLSLFYIHPV